MINKNNPYISQTFVEIRRRNLISEIGNFDITEDLIDEYIEIYGEISGTGNGRFERKYARKLAGLSFLKFKLQNGVKYSDCKEGLFYIISNEAYKNYAKVGMTIDLDGRLKSYQTYSPFRDFKVKRYEFVRDRRVTEQMVLNRYKFDIENTAGEWIEMKYADEIMNFIKK